MNVHFFKPAGIYLDLSSISAIALPEENFATRFTIHLKLHEKPLVLNNGLEVSALIDSKLRGKEYVEALTKIREDFNRAYQELLDAWRNIQPLEYTSSK